MHKQTYKGQLIAEIVLCKHIISEFLITYPPTDRALLWELTVPTLEE